MNKLSLAAGEIDHPRIEKYTMKDPSNLLFYSINSKKLNPALAEFFFELRISISFFRKETPYEMAAMYGVNSRYIGVGLR